MKKIFFSIIFSSAVFFSHAQSSKNQEVVKPRADTSVNKSNTTKNKENTAVLDTNISNRKIFKSKKTGQKGTITGHKATGTGGSHANMPKNAAHKKN